MTLSLPSPRLIAPQSVPVLRWGVIGTSIGDSFVQAVRTHPAAGGGGRGPRP